MLNPLNIVNDINIMLATRLGAVSRAVLYVPAGMLKNVYYRDNMLTIEYSDGKVERFTVLQYDIRYDNTKNIYVISLLEVNSPIKI